MLSYWKAERKTAIHHSWQQQYRLVLSLGLKTINKALNAARFVHLYNFSVKATLQTAPKIDHNLHYRSDSIAGAKSIAHPFTSHQQQPALLSSGTGNNAALIR